MGSSALMQECVYDALLCAEKAMARCIGQVLCISVELAVRPHVRFEQTIVTSHE